MGITNWWAMITLLFIPAIVVLYLLKQQAKQHNVSSLYLWRETYKTMVATTWWEKLTHNLLLYLQLLTMFLLILALAGLYFNVGKSKISNVVLVMDTSGSMNASYENSTRLEVAKQQAVAYINEVAEDTVVTVVECNKMPTIVVANSTNHNEVVSAILNIEPTDLSGDLNNASDLIGSLTTELEEYEVVLFTDSDASIETSHVKVIDVSNTGNNLSLDYVSYSIQNDRMTVLVKVSNRGIETRTTDINLYGETTLLDIGAVTLAPEASEIVYFDEISIEAVGGAWPSYLKGELNEKDDLNSDNSCYQIIEEHGTPRILLVTEQNVFLEKAIAASIEAQLYKTTSIAIAADSEDFDLYIYDGILPETFPTIGNLLILNPNRSVKAEEVGGSGSDLFEVEGTQAGAYLQTNGHEINTYFSDYTFGVNNLQLIKQPTWAQSFLEYRSYSAGFIGMYDGRAIGVVAFDVHESELPLQPEFPILMGQILNECVEGKTIANQTVQAGDNIVLYPKADATSLQIQRENRKEELVIGSMEVAYSNTNIAGLYEVTMNGTEGMSQYVGVNYPTNTESDLTKQGVIVKTTTQTGTEEVIEATTVTRGVEVKHWLLVLVLLLLLIEWYVSFRNE